jgi:hypothetical protein
LHKPCGDSHNSFTAPRHTETAAIVTWLQHPFLYTDTEMILRKPPCLHASHSLQQHSKHTGVQYHDALPEHAVRPSLRPQHKHTLQEMSARESPMPGCTATLPCAVASPVTLLATGSAYCCTVQSRTAAQYSHMHQAGPHCRRQISFTAARLP